MSKKEVMFPVPRTGAQGCIKLGKVVQRQPALAEGISCHSQSSQVAYAAPAPSCITSQDFMDHKIAGTHF